MNFDLDTCTLVGIDLSFSSTALVALNCRDGRVINRGYETTRKKFKDAYSSVLCVQSRKKDQDVDQYIADRRDKVLSFIADFLDDVMPCDGRTFVALEGYAFTLRSTRLLETAEVSGALRGELYSHCIPYRIYDPMSIKLFATGHGSAKKIEMVTTAVQAGFDVPASLLEEGMKFEQPLYINNEPAYKDVKGPGVDLSDAFHIATMLRTELMLRKGLVVLDRLKDHQRRVFLRTTKGNPVNMLEKPFVMKPELSVKEVDDE